MLECHPLCKENKQYITFRRDWFLMKTAFVIIQLISCLSLMTIIVLQTGKNSGLSALSGQSDSYLAKNKQKSRDARLALATKWVAGVFTLLTVVLNLI